MANPYSAETRVDGAVLRGNLYQNDTDVDGPYENSLEMEENGAVYHVPPPTGVSAASLYKWKARYGGMDVSEARKLRALEDENAKLKRLLADAGQLGVEGIIRRASLTP